MVGFNPPVFKISGLKARLAGGANHELKLVTIQNQLIEIYVVTMLT